MRSVRALVPVVAVLALASCGQGGTVTNTGGAGDTKPSNSQPANENPASSKPAPPAADDTLRFGGTFTWDDGVAVTLSKPVPFKPSQYAAGQEGFKDFVVVEVTVKNGSDKPLDAILITTGATTGDKQSSKVFDSAKGIDFPTAKVQPGKTLKWKEAWGVVKGADFVVTVGNGFTGDDATFQ